jgi:multidrug efflux pump subunit AcrA (membrane-fusion protein)
MVRYALAPLAVVMVLVGLAVLLGSRFTAAAPRSSEPGIEPATVTITHPERQTFGRVIEQPGRIEGYEQTALYAKISGYVDELKVDIGDSVKKGQLLAVLSVPETVEEMKQKEAAVFQAEKALEVANANLTKMKAAVRLAKATLGRADASLVRWKAQYERDRKLVATRTVDQEQFEQTTDQYRSSEAARGEAVAAVESAEAAEAESAAQVAKAQADIRVATADRDREAALLAYREIRAPFDGVIMRRDVDRGHLLQPTGAQANNGLPLYHIVRSDPVRVFVDVPEADAPLVKAGVPARVLVQALQEREFEGKVTRSSFALDMQTRTLHVQIDLPNPNGELRPGMYAKAQLSAERSEVLTVPYSSVIQRDDQSFVIRVENGKAILTPVKLGQRQGARVELLKKQPQPAGPDGRRTWEAFTGTEEIVQENPTTLADGQVVRIQGANPQLARATGRE